MLISVLSVDVQTKPTAKGSYQQAEVAYRDGEGKVGSKKVMSFTNKEVFEAMANAKQGETYDIGLVKGEKYWEWTTVKKASPAGGGAASSVQPGGAKGASAATNSRGFETPEERAKKQVYIVRQSSLTNAIATLTVGRKSEVKPEEVIDLAKQYADFVLGIGDVTKKDDGTIESIEEDDPDLPF